MGRSLSGTYHNDPSLVYETEGTFRAHFKGYTRSRTFNGNGLEWPEEPLPRGAVDCGGEFHVVILTSTPEQHEAVTQGL
jgi:hypothetical protein